MKHLWILWILSLHFLKIEGLNCSATFTKTNFVLDDYLQGQRKLCQFEVERSYPSICQLSVEFHEFQVGSNESSGCINGSLTISSEPEIRYCGKVEPQVVNIDFLSQSISFAFNLSSDNDRYNLTVRQINCPEENEIITRRIKDDCKVVDTKDFLLQSENYPRGYPNNFQSCIIVYPSSEDVCFLRLSFDEFRIEGDEVQCTKDYLQVSDIDNEKDQVRYCGVFTGIRTLGLNKAGKKIEFVSDGQNNDVGYSILALQETCPNAPTELPMGRTTTENLVEYEDYSDDDLPVYQANGTLTSQTPIATSTTKSPIFTTKWPIFTTAKPIWSSTTMSNPFLTNSPTIWTKPQPICRQNYVLGPLPTSIQSPEYPYASSQDCTYILHISSAYCSVNVNFRHFSLDPSDCSTDFLEVSEENRRFCGQLSGSRSVIGKAKSILTLRLARHFLSQGFDLTLEPIPCLHYSGWKPIINNKPIYRPTEPVAVQKPIYHHRRKKCWNWFSPLRRLLHLKINGIKRMMNFF